MLRTSLTLVAASVLAACSAMTTISSVQPNATVLIATSENKQAPRSESFRTTSFGNYEFRAEVAGLEPFYGILPLKFNGGYLALDILFFAPAALFNLREVYPFYEFDIEKKHVKFKSSTAEEWSIFVPLSADAEQGMAALGPKTSTAAK